MSARASACRASAVLPAPARGPGTYLLFAMQLETNQGLEAVGRLEFQAGCSPVVGVLSVSRPGPAQHQVNP